MDYGDRLREKRKAKHLTQEELAEKISARGHQITGAYVSMIERGYDRKIDGEPSRPKRKFVELAAEILDDDIDEALTDADYAPNNRNFEEGLYAGWKKLPKDRQELARRQMKAIIDSLAENDSNTKDENDTKH